jgi:hypothetical protein
MFLEKQARRQKIPRILSARNFLTKAILISYRRFQVLELRHIYKKFISCL